ncbi:hypothetical protein DPMN_043430 [Dreissena polymorpha]|uniref:Uncharacterized protein n=1 Tax=Dreissena polymorpha TaxID=45954 RepID=A0A9D4HVK7_DREPO|nr:hypothetical protein DPMN_043430 [Dreissena polymorpha]
MDALQNDNTKLEPLVKKLEYRNNEMNLTIKTLNTRISMFEKGTTPSSTHIIENVSVSDEFVSSSLTNTLNSDQAGRSKHKFVISCQALHDKISDIVFGEMEKKVDLIAKAFNNSSQSTCGDDSSAPSTSSLNTQYINTTDPKPFTGGPLFHATPPLPTHIIPPQTQKWTPPTFPIPPPGFPWYKGVSDYPPTSSHHPMPGNGQPVHHATCYCPITVTILHQEVFSRRLVPHVSHRVMTLIVPQLEVFS